MKKLILLSALTVALVSGVIVFDTDRAYAASGQVINRSTIKVGNQTFFDSDIDGDFNYKETNASDGCQDEIKGFTNSQLEGTSTPSKADIVISTPAGPGSSVCNDRTEEITFSSSRTNFLKAFTWNDNDTIKASDGKLTFKRDGETSTFISEKNEAGCRDTITVASNNETLTLRERVGRSAGAGAGHDYDKYPFNLGNRSYNDNTQCWESPAVNNVQIEGNPQDGNSGAADGGGGSQGTIGQNTCEDSSADLSWMLCGILRIVDGAVGWLDNQIQNMLEVPESYLNSPALEETWRRIRNIAVLILVPIVLVMVIGSALGFDFVSAYTVKRSLPRFLFAIVFLTLSFEITTFMIEFTNNVGRGLFGLMTSSFTDTGGSITLSSLLAPDGMSWEAGIFAGALVVAGAGAIAVGSIGVVLSFALVTVVALFVAFLLLAARQMILIALVILAPLAILAWVFPSNQKLWSLWWNAFTKLLMLFPLIIILIAGGRIFASIVRSVDGSGPVETLLVVTAYIAPYFFIPATFKLAGGIFATVAGIANSRERGIFDRNKKYRQEHMRQNWERNGQRQVMQRRATLARNLEGQASKGNIVKRRAFGLAAKGVGGYNLEAAMSAKTAQVSKEFGDQINSGKDDDIRGLTAKYSYDYARQHGLKNAMDDGYAQYGSDGKTIQYKTLAGAYVNEANVRNGISRWGNDSFAQQAALSYEMRKASSDTEVENLTGNYSSLANSWGMTDDQKGGAWIGAAFENQGQHLELKHTRFDSKTGAPTLKSSDFVKEIYEKKGSYPLAQMSAHTVKQLKNAYDYGNDDDKRKVREIADTFVVRGGGNITGMAGDGEVPITTPAAPGRTSEPIVSASGAAHVNEAVKDLYRHVNPQSPPQMPGQGNLF